MKGTRLMNVNRYKVHIKIPGFTFLVKNRVTRTPFEAIVSEDELKTIISTINSYGISETNVQIEEMNKQHSVINEQPKIKISQSKQKKSEQKIKEVKSEEKSTLDSFID
jgi:hypothetical protein